MSSQSGVVQRIERKLETAVGDAFARAFGGSIVPEEIETMLRREAADEVRSLEGNHLLVPNEYVITLSVHDYDKTVADPDLTANAFAKHLAEFIGEQGWQTYGEVAVRFEPSARLHTGQFRTRGDVNPDANPPPNTNNTSPPQSTHHAFSAETGVAPMTDNPSYRGNQGQGRPEDEYYDDRYGRPPHDDDRYGRPQDDPWGGQDIRGGQEPRAPYPPEQGGYPPQQDQGYPPPRRPDQGGYPDQGPGGYQPPYEPRPAAGYGGGQGGYDAGYGGGQGGYDAGYRQPPQPPAGYGPPPGGPQGYGDYGRGPARPDDGGYGPPEQRPVYPEQGGGYDQGYPGGAPYGRQDYGRPDYGRYPEAPPAGYDYGQPPSGYAEPGGYDYSQPPSGYDYGQPPSGYDYSQPPGGYGGYGGYGQGGYPSVAPGVTLQLDDGSGRTYQLTQGVNVVGRGQDAQFRLPDTGVSRRHLEIRWDGRVALLSDLNSTNGTTVNNAPVQEWQLADGDVIRLGHSEIVVHVH